MVPKLASLHVLLVERGTVRNAYWVPGFDLAVLKMEKSEGFSY